MTDGAGATDQEKRADGNEAPGEVSAPLGTMVIVLLYALGTIALWSYVYYHTLRYGGVLGGH